ncbi:acyltransferase [Mangrovibacterium diazotrophicum]|uniref:Acetyltransferase-like isoleucine patch superfamily enzyme n=1 Tax=Mangrovibacterium diazotrophicum TaxID=1261403 RepID=A0A419VXI1_9BACT|nr:acyltransferase [Mangrovibacterium diazotrophicum]RKD87932.1 acetyltransferase-like isoleucine patch superfamily enzyme [Mangrovibacterium diazotrophicum]
MKQALKSVVKGNPIVEKYARILMNRNNFAALFPRKRISGKNNIIRVKNSVILNNCKFDIAGNNNSVEIHCSAILNNVTFFIRGNQNKIEIGEKVRFWRGGELWIEDYNGTIKIGNHSTFENTHIAVTEPYSKIEIGEDCMFAYGIDIRTGDSHSIIDINTNKRINYAQDISIGNHVWVASHASILKGVTIGDNSVIATRSVVTKNFEEDHILVGGSPARKLKEGINWDRQRIYEEEQRIIAS